MEATCLFPGERTFRVQKEAAKGSFVGFAGTLPLRFII
jgi:hypothetical protein